MLWQKLGLAAALQRGWYRYVALFNTDCLPGKSILLHIYMVGCQVRNNKYGETNTNSAKEFSGFQMQPWFAELEQLCPALEWSCKAGWWLSEL